jgi:carbonic anhydrase/acetyltransferase-like protein (isoleucine patch superfamily)
MANEVRDQQSLQQSLARVQDALAKMERAPAEALASMVRTSAEAMAKQQSLLAEAALRPGGTAPFKSSSLADGLAVAAFLLVTGAAIGSWPLVTVALALAAVGSAAFAIRRSRPAAGPSSAAYIGMGATVAEDAVVEPGAVIEMGAEVKAGAVVRSGAMVRVGATVGRNAVIESGAVVSWGADVHKGAVVGEGAVVGAGSDVHAGARLPAGMRLRPGSDFSSGRLKKGQQRLERAAMPAAALPDRDPHDARLEAICDKLGPELRAAPDTVRGFLAAPESTIASLRSACADLLARERSLRAECEPTAIARLKEERAVLQARIASAADERVRASLQGATAAIDEQLRQREQLHLGAERLEAEHMRLLYTLEGLGSLFVRLRTAGAEAREAPAAELERGVSRLKEELAAIAEALEQVSRAPQPEATARLDAAFRHHAKESS